MIVLKHFLKEKVKSMAIKKGAEIEPAKGKLGVLLVGLGAVSTTFIAGVEAIKKGLAEPIGSLTQMGAIRLGKRTDYRVPFVKDFVPLADLNDLVFGAWYIFPDSAYEAAVHAAFEKFSGDFYQMPPMVSAIKQGGVPLYKLAREGKTVEREPRLVHVYRYSIDRVALQEIDFTVVCSKGFYVRTYAHDIGEVLGCGAHLKNLRRTKSGRFSVEGAITVDELKTSEPVNILPRILTLPEVSRMRGA